MSGVGLSPSTKQIIETANKLNRAPDFPYSLVQPVRELDDIANDLIKNGPKVDKQLDFLKIQLAQKQSPYQIENSPLTPQKERACVVEFIEQPLESSPEMKTGDIPATDKALFKCPEPKVDIIESNVQARISDYDPDKTIDSKNADFFYVNGIQTTPEDAEHTSGILSGIMDKGVKNIWSEKKSCLVNDLIKAVKIDQQNSTGTISTQTASEICDNVLKSLKSGKNVKLIAHSRGGSEVANALWETRSRLAAFGGYSTEQINKMMQKVEVITMGGLASPSHFPYDIKLTQIRNPKDPVPELNENMGNIRPRYSRTEIQKAVDEKIKGSPLTKDELAAVYQKNVDAGGLVTHLYNVKEKLAYGVNVLGKETATVATVAGGAFGARVLMGVIPKNAIVLGQAVSQSMSSFAYRAGINISVSGSKVVALNLVKSQKLTTSTAANIVKPIVNAAFKVSPQMGAKTANAFAKIGVNIYIGKNTVSAISVGNLTRQAVIRSTMANIGKVAPVVGKGVFSKAGIKAFEASLKMTSKGSNLLQMEKLMAIKPGLIVKVGGVAILAAAVYGGYKIGMSHLVDAGPSNYLGQKGVQKALNQASGKSPNP